MRKIESKDIRKSILSIAKSAKSPHIASALSCADILYTLFFEVMYIPRAEEPEFIHRDMFLLSKAHSAMALYASLYHKGFMSKAQIEGYYKNAGSLPAHTDRQSSPYIEISAGSLGHGLPIAVGMAMALKNKPSTRKRYVFTLMGDGEIQEGSVWEAAMFAPKYNLNNLIALVDRNNLQGYGRGSELVSFEPLESKWQAFGWECVRVDGHNIKAMRECIKTYQQSNSTKPLCLICDTTKGKGVSFMEDKLEWHYFLVTNEVYDKALKELE